MSEQKPTEKEAPTPTPPTEEKVPIALTETLDAKIAVYDGDRYLFTIGVTSEFLKNEGYNRSTMHDAMMEYLYEKSQEYRAQHEAAKIPEMDLSEIEGLTWMSYKTKERAKEGDAAWTKNPKIFQDIDAPIAGKLAEAIEKAGGKLELGAYLFSFSGDGNRFISRRPLKRKEGR